jgi:tripartite-type tricarboxylate transporter receptor subunit TctC
MRLTVALTLLAVSATLSHADEVAEFYKGKAVTIVVGSSAGGGYDTVARTAARFLGKHIPGHPAVIVRNLAGAGGLAAANALFAGAPNDGSQIGLIPNTVPFEPLMGNKQARYDATRFEWLGSPSVETAMLAVWNTVPARSLADITTRQTTVGAARGNSTSAFYARLLNDVFDTRLKVVTGYAGQTEALMAMEQREVEGYAEILLSALMVTRADWLADRKLRPLLYFGPVKRPELAPAQYAPDLVTNEDDRALIDAAFAPLALGRPFALPPGAPAQRVAALRKALADTFNDPQFRAEGERLALAADTPQSGAQIADVIRRAYATPPRVLDRLRKLDKVQP